MWKCEYCLLRKAVNDADVAGSSRSEELLLYGGERLHRAFADSCFFFTKAQELSSCCKSGCHTQHMYDASIFQQFVPHA